MTVLCIDLLFLLICMFNVVILTRSSYLTQGHTMEVTGAQWHPSEKGILLTSSMDGSLRIWDLAGEANFGNLCNKHVLKVRGKSGQPRVGARCCTYSLDGQYFSAYNIVCLFAFGSHHSVVIDH
jgi:WD40 repeat protein